MKKSIAVVLFGFINCSILEAQTFQEKKNFISLGYGFGPLEGIQYEQKRSEMNYSKTGIGPIYLKFEHALSEKVGFSVQGAYNDVDISFDHGNNFYPGYRERAGFTSYSIFARLNLHFGKNEKFDPYFGVGAGYRHLSRRFSSGAPPGQAQNSYDVDILDYIPVGIEATFGTRYMFTKSLGIYAEMGLAKSFFQIGLTTRF